MIPTNQLKLLVKNTTLALVKSNPVIQSTYQAIAPDTIIAEATFSANVDRFDQYEKADAATFSLALSWFSSIKEWHRPQDVLNDLSFHDASLILKDWAFSKPGNLWTILHPISGVFTGLKITVKNGRPTLRGRMIAVLSQVATPSTWSWASSGGVEELTVRCIEVDGADSYNIYANVGLSYDLLGSVSTHSPSTISVPGGYYRIRIAPVRGGIVGIMGNEIQVQIEGGGVPAPPDVDETPLLAESIPEKRNKLLEWLRSFRRD